MKRKDNFGEDIDFKLEVFLDKCTDYGCLGYHYVILAFYKPNDEKRIPFWHNTGICGIEESPDKAFSEGLRRFNESE